MIDSSFFHNVIGGMSRLDRAIHRDVTLADRADPDVVIPTPRAVEFAAITIEHSLRGVREGLRR